MIKKYLFLDRDGTLIKEPLDFQIDTIEKFELLPDVISSLLLFKKSGYSFVMVSNQDGLGSDAYPMTRFEMIQKLLLDILRSQGIEFEAILICPHRELDHCSCRKPQTNLVRDYLSGSKWNEWDRDRSFVIGDRQTDLALAENMGIPGIQIQSDVDWKAITQKILTQPRTGKAVRKTKETQISAKVTLDVEPKVEISTGIGFFNHMIEQLSYHGGFSTLLEVEGDLHIDEHHTIEDTAITLGSALRQALGDKIGIERFGFSLPMDEALTQVALDLSGRGYFKFNGNFSRESVGGLATEMIPHFFRSFSESLGVTLHLEIQGENTHHQIESAFKGVGRALRLAIQRSGSSHLPSTKGIL